MRHLFDIHIVPNQSIYNDVGLQLLAVQGNL